MESVYQMRYGGGGRQTADFLVRTIERIHASYYNEENYIQRKKDGHYV